MLRISIYCKIQMCFQYFFLQEDVTLIFFRYLRMHFSIDHVFTYVFILGDCFLSDEKYFPIQIKFRLKICLAYAYIFGNSQLHYAYSRYAYKIRLNSEIMILEKCTEIFMGFHNFAENNKRFHFPGKKLENGF